MTAVIATRDRPGLLADALASIAAQSAPPLEVRIGNDGDADPGPALRQLGGIEAVVVPAGAGRAGEARNRAARGARGEVLAFLDDDDRWLPGHLEALAGALADPAADLAFTDSAIVLETVGEHGERVERERRVIARNWDPERMRRNDYLPPSAWGVRRVLFERLGGFDSAFRFSEDWDFLLRAAALTTPRRVPGVTVEVRMRPGGNASSDAGPERFACLRRLAARHGLPPIEPRTFWEVAGLVDEGAGSDERAARGGPGA